MREGEARGRLEEARAGIEMALEIKFGEAGLALMPAIAHITELSQLKAIQQAIKTAATVEQLQQRLQQLL